MPVLQVMSELISDATTDGGLVLSSASMCGDEMLVHMVNWQEIL